MIKLKIEWVTWELKICQSSSSTGFRYSLHWSTQLLNTQQKRSVIPDVPLASYSVSFSPICSPPSTPQRMKRNQMPTTKWERSLSWQGASKLDADTGLAPMPTFGVVSVPPNHILISWMVPCSRRKSLEEVNAPDRIPRSQSNPLRDRTVLFLRFRELLLGAEGFMGLRVCCHRIVSILIFILFVLRAWKSTHSHTIIERRNKAEGTYRHFAEARIVCRGVRGPVLVEKVNCRRWFDLWVGTIWARLRLEPQSRDQRVAEKRSSGL